MSEVLAMASSVDVANCTGAAAAAAADAADAAAAWLCTSVWEKSMLAQCTFTSELKRLSVVWVCYSECIFA